MSTEDTASYRQRAHDWLQAQMAEFGPEVRKGLTPQQDLALGRRYQRAKFEAGYAGIDLPTAFGGQGLPPLYKVLFETEEMGFVVPSEYFAVSLGMPIPILIVHGQDKDWVRERAIAALRGDEIWCQLFSEPSGGSDLAGLRTKARPEGNGWRVDGQKLWTTYAQHSDYGIIVTRTDPTVPKHKGLTYFWIDMHAPGVSVRPVRLADGSDHVNEVYFDGAPMTDGQRMGAVGGGFGVALQTLMIERYAGSDSAGFGPRLEHFIDIAKRTKVAGKPAIEDGRIRGAIARHYTLRNGLEAISHRAMLMLEQGMEPGPEGSLNKLLSVRGRQRLSELALDLQGALALPYDDQAPVRGDWAASWMDAPTGRLAGGADEILLNTIAEKVLGLPQDHRPDKNVPFDQIGV